MKTFGIIALALTALGATAYVKRDKIKPLIDQFADRRRTLSAPA